MKTFHSTALTCLSIVAIAATIVLGVQSAKPAASTALATVTITAARMTEQEKIAYDHEHNLRENSIAAN
ncbi:MULTISPECIES: hypothetical protein [unclassified Undibacterium]|uniref:hypothetical protein n=1 Tax=unclassified Undibacterium TaxID=2630295 RepID=UPI002AC8FD68|nr:MULTISPECIES: hypothetical protein [unclassified Undibacterium]MEB0138289.1 hypothetical protein [Undibacterium sp. CCC2.1]MEB0170775.1 hypothetical protein [Undibacterium sp. CCC1.1]MEB0174664.1 hypothetical protein [Undibacterium sp. CCC3.4]MEB0213861.1 hypothetical protein [Undibacterium sp. 5I2]WPX42587.1 hypothetical protein RHM61_14480 [Undibacterium sp. CCC3.4]